MLTKGPELGATDEGRRRQLAAFDRSDLHGDKLSIFYDEECPTDFRRDTKTLKLNGLTK